MDALKFQIGKNGITQGTFDTLDTAFKSHKQIRVSVLKSSGRDRNNIEEMAQQLVSGLKTKCDHKVLGFTIILIKKLYR